MPSTGTITLNPRSAAAPAVCSTEVCACVPIATTVLMALSFFQVAADELVGADGAQDGFSRPGRQLLENVRVSRAGPGDAVDDQRTLGAGVIDQLRHFRH